MQKKETQDSLRIVHDFAISIKEPAAFLQGKLPEIKPLAYLLSSLTVTSRKGFQSFLKTLREYTKLVNTCKLTDVITQSHICRDGNTCWLSVFGKR